MLTDTGAAKDNAKLGAIAFWVGSGVNFVKLRS